MKQRKEQRTFVPGPSAIKGVGVNNRLMAVVVISSQEDCDCLVDVI